MIMPGLAEVAHKSCIGASLSCLSQKCHTFALPLRFFLFVFFLIRTDQILEEWKIIFFRNVKEIGCSLFLGKLYWLGWIVFYCFAGSGETQCFYYEISDVR